ncbi:MAG: TetR/AcrR family transcriptional regulator [Bdellovibrio sp.]|nr:TetR/AcrR family transcriptional regulator [Bdellovibrio sp.]
MAKANVTKEQWLDEGLKCFGRHGLKGLNVEDMAKKLGSSKAGFYWYFKSRDEYINALFNFWHEKETNAAIALSRGEANPIDKLEALFQAPAKIKIYRDVLFQIRNLASSRKSFRNLLESIENQRIKYVSDIFAELGYPKSKAIRLGQFLYCYYLGWYERIKDKKITQDEMHKQFQLVSSLLNIRGGR